MYRNPGALPRAGVVGAQRSSPGEEAQLAAVLDPSFRRAAYRDHTGGIARLSTRPLPGAAGWARILDQEAERVTVQATARRPAALVLTDLHYAGWKAELDGRPVEVHRVDYLLRGVALPAGRHRLELRYEPASWLLGRLISLVALLILIAVLAAPALPRWRGG